MGSPSPSRSLFGPGEVLLGRSDELELLDGALAQALEPHGRLFLIAGEPGIGKTTLARTFSARAAARGALAVWGRSWESGGAPPFWPWTQVLRVCLEDPLLRDAVDALGSAGGQLRMLASGMVDRAVGGDDSADSKQARFGVFDAVARFFGRAADRTTMLIVLEDLHAADLASLLLLKFVARQIDDQRVVILGTLRRPEAARRPEVLAELTDIGREGVVLELGGLDRGALALLIERAGGAKPSRAVVDRVFEVTEGNPLFAEQIALALSRQGRLQQGSGVSLPLPDTVRDTIDRKIGPLPELQRAVLDVASVVGPEFDLEILSSVLGATRASVEESVEWLERELLVERIADGRCRFAHALVRDAIHEALPRCRRADLHTQVGWAIERIRGDHVDEHLAEIADHLYRAAREGGNDGVAAAAFERSIAAGAHARRLLAFEDACSLIERALELAPAAGIDARRRGETLVALGEARVLAGRMAEAVAPLDEAAEIARQTGAWDLLAQAAVARGQKLTGGVIHHDLIALINEAIAHLRPEDLEMRARLLSRLGLELITVPEREQREAVVREAVEVARRTGSDRTLAVALDAKAFGLHLPDVVQESLDAATELLEVGRRLGDPAVEAAAHGTRLQALIQLGRGDQFLAGVEELERAAAASRQALHMWSSRVAVATRDTMRGSFDVAERRAKAALEVGGGVPGAQAAYFNQLFATAYLRGGLTPMEGVVRNLADQTPRFRPMWAAALALIFAESGRHVEVRQELDIVVTDLPALMRGPAALPALAWASESCRLAGDSSVAAALHESLLPYEHLQVSMTARVPASYWGTVQLWLARLETLLGRLEDAERRLHIALDAERRLGAAPFIAHTEMTLASLLLRVGRDADQARYLLASAAATAERLRMGRLLAEVEALATGADGQGQRDHERPEFRSEGEFWTVAYAGSLSRFKDSKGLRYLATLLGSPRREHHVLELLAAVEGPPTSPELVEADDHALRRARPADSGPVLDAEAMAAYRRRLEDLRQEFEEAESWRDPERAARAREEMDFVARELAGALGLGGRGRRTAAPAEQVRVNVTKAIRSAIKKIEASNAALGRHLRADVRTGTYCSYGATAESLPPWRLT